LCLMGQGETQYYQKRESVNCAYLPQFWPEEINGQPLEEATVEDFFHWIKGVVADPNDEVTTNMMIREARRVKFATSSGAERLDQSWFKRKVSTYSGGEQRALWFMMASKMDIDTLLLDEPTNHMDRDLQGTITQAIQDFPGAVVLASHDTDLMSALSRDTGKKVGAGMLTHLVLEKEDGETVIYEEDEMPDTYMDKTKEAARKTARKIKFN